MARVELPGGHTAVIGLRMAEFRELWQSGAVRKLEGLAAEGGDLAEAYPLMAKCVKQWDVKGPDGQDLEPGAVASYDEIEPGTFMRLMGAVARYISGEDTKN